MINYLFKSICMFASKLEAIFILDITDEYIQTGIIHCSPPGNQAQAVHAIANLEGTTPGESRKLG